MDKETLSNYGWIVICVLVLAVMIALAGPFGNFVADAVKSTAQGLFDVNQNALDAAGIVIEDNEFADTNGDSESIVLPDIVTQYTQEDIDNSFNAGVKKAKTDWQKDEKDKEFLEWKKSNQNDSEKIAELHKDKN